MKNNFKKDLENLKAFPTVPSIKKEAKRLIKKYGTIKQEIILNRLNEILNAKLGIR